MCPQRKKERRNDDRAKWQAAGFLGPTANDGYGTGCVGSGPEESPWVWLMSLRAPDRAVSTEQVQNGCFAILLAFVSRDICRDFQVVVSPKHISQVVDPCYHPDPSGVERH